MTMFRRNREGRNGMSMTGRLAGVRRIRDGGAQYVSIYQRMLHSGWRGVWREVGRGEEGAEVD